MPACHSAPRFIPSLSAASMHERAITRSRCIRIAQREYEVDHTLISLIHNRGKENGVCDHPTLTNTQERRTDQAQVMCANLTNWRPAAPPWQQTVPATCGQSARLFGAKALWARPR